MREQSPILSTIRRLRVTTRQQLLDRGDDRQIRGKPGDVVQLVRTQPAQREVLERAVIVDDPTLAIIGRRVTLEEADGATSTYALVVPGDGDPRNGFISGDSPVGAALIRRRIGQEVTIQAPAGSWSATITSID